MAVLNAGINVGFGFLKVAAGNGESAVPLLSPTAAQGVRYAEQQYKVGEARRCAAAGSNSRSSTGTGPPRSRPKVLAQSVVRRLAQPSEFAKRIDTKSALHDVRASQSATHSVNRAKASNHGTRFPDE